MSVVWQVEPQLSWGRVVGGCGTTGGWECVGQNLSVEAEAVKQGEGRKVKQQPLRCESSWTKPSSVKNGSSGNSGNWQRCVTLGINRAFFLKAVIPKGVPQHSGAEDVSGWEEQTFLHQVRLENAAWGKVNQISFLSGDFNMPPYLVTPSKEDASWRVAQIFWVQNFFFFF